MRTSEPLDGLLQGNVPLNESRLPASEDSNAMDIAEDDGAAADVSLDPRCAGSVSGEELHDGRSLGLSPEVSVFDMDALSSVLKSSCSSSCFSMPQQQLTRSGTESSWVSYLSELVGIRSSMLTVQSFDDEAITKVFHEANTTKVKESAWDLSLFLFCGPLGVITNIMVFLCVAFNTLLQVSFTYLVAGFIASSNEDLGDLAADFAVWRDGASASVQALVCDSNFAWRSDFSSSWTRASLTTSAPRPMQG